MSATTPRPLLYHLLMAVGLLVMIGWMALMREVGFMTWLAKQGPATHTGALNLVAIMLWMLPALLAWKYYLRWLHRTLQVRGRYYEDDYYRNSPPAPKGSADQQRQPESQADSDSDPQPEKPRDER